MKTKVAIWTALVLCCILIVLDTFIYFTLRNRLMGAEVAALVSKANSVAQMFKSVSDSRQNSESRVSSSDSDHDQHSDGPLSGVNPEWLARYAQYGQSIVLFDKNGKVLAHTGTRANSHVIQWFAQNTVSSGDSEEHHNRATHHLRSVQQMDTSLFVESAIVADDTHLRVGYVVAMTSTKSVGQYMANLLVLLIAGSAGAVLLAAVGGYIVSALAVRPLNQMIRLVRQIQVNRLNERLAVPKGHDEIARLASTFNTMLHRIERSFEQQSRFVADASHEMRTPLTTIQGYVGLLSRWGKNDPQVLESGLAIISKEASRLRNLAEDLLTLAALEVVEAQSGQFSDVDEVVKETLDSIAPLHPDIQVTKDLHATGQTLISAGHLHQILNNLVDNAFKYSGVKGEVTVKTSVDGLDTVLEVRDNGPGIPKDDLPYVFERFYRVDKSRGRSEGGAGLGLAIVKELVELYKGLISVESEVGAGTRFIVRLPRREGPESGSMQSRITVPPRGGV